MLEAFEIDYGRIVQIELNKAKKYPEHKAAEAAAKGKKYMISFPGDGSRDDEQPYVKDLWKDRMMGLVIDVKCKPVQDGGEYTKLEFDHRDETDTKGGEFYRVGKIRG